MLKPTFRLVRNFLPAIAGFVLFVIAIATSQAAGALGMKQLASRLEALAAEAGLALGQELGRQRLGPVGVDPGGVLGRELLARRTHDQP